MLRQVNLWLVHNHTRHHTSPGLNYHTLENLGHFHLYHCVHLQASSWHYPLSKIRFLWFCVSHKTGSTMWPYHVIQQGTLQLSLSPPSDLCMVLFSTSLVTCSRDICRCLKLRKVCNQTTIKPSKCCIRTACPKLSTSLELVTTFWFYQTCCKIVPTSLIQSWNNNIVTTLCRQPCNILVISLLYRTC
jgi:hypothetical protein